MSAIIKIVLAMTIWGSLGIVVRLIELPSVEVGFVRGFISGFALLIIRLFLIKDKFNYKIKNILIMIASGAALGLNWILLFSAYRYTTISNATTSYYMAPVFAVIFARFILNERLTAKKAISITISALGLILILSQNNEVTVDEGNLLLGISSGLLAAVFYAVVIISNRLVREIISIDKAIIQIISATVMLLPFIVTRGVLERPGVNSLILFFVIGIIHTALPYLLYFNNIEKVSVLNSAVLSYIDPFTAILFGFFIFGEPLSVYHLLGGGMIILSLFLSIDK